MERESQVLEVPVEEIIPNRFQPRLNFSDNALDELAASIKEHGIIQPLVLRRLGNKYEIIAGERRYKAGIMAGLTTVPAIISNIDDNKSAEVAIVENLQRKNLSAIEEAISYRNLLSRGYITQEQLAQKLGISQSAIANKLRLLNLPDEVQKALMEEKISERHARSLLNVPNVETQLILLSRVISERMPVRMLDVEIKNILGDNVVIPTDEQSEPVVQNNDVLTPNVNNVISNDIPTTTSMVNEVSVPQPSVSQNNMMETINNMEQNPMNPSFAPIEIDELSNDVEIPQPQFTNTQNTGIVQEPTPAPKNPIYAEFGNPMNMAEMTATPTTPQASAFVPESPIQNIPQASTYEDFKPANEDSGIRTNKFFTLREPEPVPEEVQVERMNAMPYQDFIINDNTSVAPAPTLEPVAPAAPEPIVDPAGYIAKLDPNYVETEKNQNPEDYQLTDVIEDVRNLATKIEIKKFVVNLDELDLDDKYQFVITVNKE